MFNMYKPWVVSINFSVSSWDFGVISFDFGVINFNFGVGQVLFFNLFATGDAYMQLCINFSIVHNDMLVANGLGICSWLLNIINQCQKNPCLVYRSHWRQIL